MSLARSISVRRNVVLAVALGAVVALIAGGWWFAGRDRASADSHAADESLATTVADETDSTESPAESGLIEFPRESWQAASLTLQPAEQGALDEAVSFTGKIALNEDRVAHLFPLVEGRVKEVKVRFGDKVKKGDVLVVVQSKEIGQAMLQLYQDRLNRDFAVKKDQWTQTVAKNAQEMIQLIRDGASIEELESQLRDRPLGQYRDQLMAAYLARYKAGKNIDRLTPLSKDGAIAGKQLLEAETELNAAQAALQSLLEQLQQDMRQASAISSQEVKELQTRVAVGETNLRILGVEDEALAKIDPKQGEAVSHYSIKAPFDGTILTKDVALLERVGPESQILSIADLSSVWVTADVFEEHLPRLESLEGETVELLCDSWPGKAFQAEIFYAGDVVDETTRTVSMRAVAKNDEGLLKPGLFVKVQLPNLKTTPVVQAPRTAVFEHEGQAFVFVHKQGDQFERRDVKLGRQNPQAVEIVAGLQPGEMVVTSGGFALKSQMLAELLAE